MNLTGINEMIQENRELRDRVNMLEKRNDR